MKKNFFLNLICFLLLFLSFSATANIISDFILVNYKLMINETEIKTSSGENPQSIVYNDTAYVPIRILAESSGKKVTWDEENQTISVDDYFLTEISLSGGQDQTAAIHMNGEIGLGGGKFTYKEINIPLAEPVISEIKAGIFGVPQFLSAKANSPYVVVKVQQASWNNPVYKIDLYVQDKIVKTYSIPWKRMTLEERFDFSDPEPSDIREFLYISYLSYHKGAEELTAFFKKDGTYLVIPTKKVDEFERTLSESLTWEEKAKQIYDASESGYFDAYAIEG